MTTQNYLVVENNIADNLVIWDGDTNIWQPPAGATMLVQATTPAMVWELSSDKTNYVLVEVVGAGDIGFTWNGSVLTTSQPQPAPVIQPTTSGTKTA
jgi:hypothetical protein